MWEGVFSKSKRIMMLKSEVDILRRELESYKHFRKKDDERNYEKITKCIAKTAFIEVQIEGTMMPLKNRINTLEQQIADGMNREEEWKRRLAKIETGMFVDQMKVDGVWREEPKEDDFEPRVGDLVVSTENPTDIRKVLGNGFGIQMVGKTDIKMYNRWDLVKDVMREWKVIARREDLK